MLVKLVHSVKVYLSIFVMVLGNVILTKLVQYLKDHPLMYSTPSGIVILFILLPSNALSPISVTFFPSISLGILTFFL